MLVIEPTPGRELQWQEINWTAATANVRRLQGRIFRAARRGEWAKVKSLQKLLVHSQAAKLLAIRQVTQQKLALEPEWESRFEPNSYGVRPGRSTMDAIRAIHTTMASR